MADGRTILVTGSTDGLGLACATELAAEGGTVLLHGRDDGRLERARAAITERNASASLGSYRADLASLEEVRELADRILGEQERLDVLVRTLQKRMPGVELALRTHLPVTSSYDSLATRAQTSEMPGHDQKLTPAEAAALNDLIKLMRDTATQILRYTKQYSPKPIPDPELRVRPPL